MEHKMRRFKQQLAIEEAAEILYNSTNGVLSLVDTEGAPYGVPIYGAQNEAFDVEVGRF